MSDPPGDGHVTAWRLDQLEDGMKMLARVVQESGSALGAQITALSNQMGRFEVNLPNVYSPRREAEERHQAIEERFSAFDHRLDERKRAVDERIGTIERTFGERITTLERTFDDNIKTNRMRIERIEQAGWAFAIGMVVMLLGVVFAIFRAMGSGG